MKRTQIYLTGERKALAAIAGRTGKSQSEFIREAVDHFIARHREGNRPESLRAARGIWRNREGSSGFVEIRRELDERGGVGR